MTKSEIQELLRLKEWSTARLAAELDCSENSVQNWINGRRNPGGPACVLMKLWLKEAREEAKLTKAG